MLSGRSKTVILLHPDVRMFSRHFAGHFEDDVDEKVSPIAVVKHTANKEHVIYDFKSLLYFP